jgi:hypothetical protein
VPVAANRKLTGTSPVSLEREGGPLVAANRKLTGTSPVSLEREGCPLVAANRKLTGTSPVSLEREGGTLVAANRKLTGTSPVSPEQAACRTGLERPCFPHASISGLDFYVNKRYGRNRPAWGPVFWSPALRDFVIIWDDEDDPEGNYCHICRRKR